MTICLNELPAYNLFWRVLFSSIEEFEVAEISNLTEVGTWEVNYIELQKID